MMDFAQFGLVMMKHVREFVQPAIDTLTKEFREAHAATQARIDALPAPEAGKDGAPGKDGVSVDAEAVQRMIDEAVAKAIAALPVPKDGRDGVDGAAGSDAAPIDPVVVKALVDEAVALIPAPKDGRDGVDGVPGKDGADAEPIDPEVVKLMVAEAVGAIPIPKDGAAGRDGVDGAAGVAGIDGKSCAPEDVLALLGDKIEKALAGITPPRDGRDGLVGKDGADGKDGLDGLGFDDLTVEQTDGRAIVLRFAKGERVKEFPVRLAGFEYRGVYKEGEAYEKGDVVTWGGSMFVAREATKSKPETDATWSLSCKRGRDGSAGRDGKDFAPPKPVRP